MMQVAQIRESILNAPDKESLAKIVKIADQIANVLDEIPDRTKRRWKLAEKRAEKRLQLKTEAVEAKTKKGKRK